MGGGKSLEELKARIAELYKEHNTLIMQTAKDAGSKFAPHQKAVAALLPRLQKAQKGEAVEFSDSERVQLRNAAAAGETLVALSCVFPATIAEQLKTITTLAQAAKQSFKKLLASPEQEKMIFSMAMQLWAEQSGKAVYRTLCNLQELKEPPKVPNLIYDFIKSELQKLLLTTYNDAVERGFKAFDIFTAATAPKLIMTLEEVAKDVEEKFLQFGKDKKQHELLWLGYKTKNSHKTEEQRSSEYFAWNGQPPFLPPVSAIKQSFIAACIKVLPDQSSNDDLNDSQMAGYMEIYVRIKAKGGYELYKTPITFNDLSGNALKEIKANFKLQTPIVNTPFNIEVYLYYEQSAVEAAMDIITFQYRYDVAFRRNGNWEVIPYAYERDKATKNILDLLESHFLDTLTLEQVKFS